MRFQLFFFSFWIFISLNAQHQLVVKTEFAQLLPSAAHSVQYLSDDYYLIEAINTITINKDWEFYVKPKTTSKHISFHTNELIIRTNTLLTQDQERSLSLFGEYQINPHNKTLYLIKTKDREIDAVKNKQTRIQQLEFIKTAQINQYFTLSDCSNDPLYERQWYVENTGSPIQYNGTPGADIGGVEAWEVSKGTDVIVAVLDSGIDTLHPEFSSRLLPGFDAFATDSINTSGYPFLNFDENAHGTACAGIIGAAKDNEIGIGGIAPECKLVPVRIFFYIELNNQIVPFTNMNALLTGSAYSWNTIGADIISCSAGLTPEFINLLTIDTTLCNEELLLAYNEGRNGNGTIMFFSAGNENSPNVLWPANMSRTIAVGASDMCDTRKRPNDCSGENWWGSDYGETLDFVAPGVKIATCDITGNLGYSSNDYALTFNGTSAACPIAAGVGALLLSENPELTANEVRHLLNVTSEKVEPYAYDSLNVDGSWNEEVGHGRINAYEALIQVFNADTSPKHPAQSLTIYPNPNQGLINIKGLNSTSTFVIYDLMGKKQHSGVVTINNSEIQTTNLKPGIYHLNLRNHVIKFVLL